MNPTQLMHQRRRLMVSKVLLDHRTQCKYLRYGSFETIQVLVFMVLEGLVFLDHTVNSSRPSKRRL